MALSSDQLPIENMQRITRLEASHEGLKESIATLVGEMKALTLRVDKLLEQNIQDRAIQSEHKKRKRFIEKIFYPVVITGVTVMVAKVFGIIDALLKLV